MNTRILIAAVVVSMFVLCQQVHAQDEEDPEQTEVTELEGTWEFVSELHMGKQREGDGGQWRLQGNRMYNRGGDDEDWTDIGAFSLDPSAMPAEIDLMMTAFPDETEFISIPGIYELDGDSLTICSATIGQPEPRARLEAGARPDVFESPEGSRTILTVYRRVEEDSE